MSAAPNCAVPSCPNAVKYYGLCTAHYYERSAADTSRPKLADPVPAGEATASA